MKDDSGLLERPLTFFGIQTIGESPISETGEERQDLTTGGDDFLTTFRVDEAKQAILEDLLGVLVKETERPGTSLQPPEQLPRRR